MIDVEKIVHLKWRKRWEEYKNLKSPAVSHSQEERLRGRVLFGSG